MAVEVMVVGAHPDDQEIGMGGTISALTEAGRRVVLVDLTDGEPTPMGSPEIRRREAGSAAAVLGAERITLQLPNRELFDSVSARRALAAVIREQRPQLLFLPYYRDAHPDHVQASELGSAARFYSKFVKGDLPHEPCFPRKILYYFCLHISLKRPPDFVFDVSGQMERKLRALEAYRSQFVDNERNRGIFDRLRTVNAYWGQTVGCSYAEPFACSEQIRLTSPESLLDV